MLLKQLRRVKYLATEGSYVAVPPVAQRKSLLMPLLCC